jgi:hypothetical protein
MPNVLVPISYHSLTSRQKEAYNFQKVSAVLADFGFVTIHLSSDWGGADFIAQHIDGTTFLKVQLKGRLTFDDKYSGKDLHICFHENDVWYLYPHDELLKSLLTEGFFIGTSSWEDKKGYSVPGLSKRLETLLRPYRLGSEVTHI